MEYHKIQTVFKRDPATKHKTLLLGEYSLPEFEYLAKNTWVITEKVDGTNIRVMLDGDGNLTFGGRTNNAQLPAKLYKALTDLFPQPAKLHCIFPNGVILYGEGYGAGIQKGGGLYRPDQSFVLFDVRVGGYWLQREDVVKIADVLGLEVVPVIAELDVDGMVDLCKDGFFSQWGKNVRAEGIVARPKVELLTKRGHRIITKLKCRDFS